MKNTGAYRDGFHVNSNYWQDYKRSLPSVLPQDLFEIGVGSLLGDSTQYKLKRDGAKIKFEQGYMHKEYVDQIWFQFQQWTFYISPKDYVAKKGPRNGLVKSYYFRTFGHPAFSVFRDIFLDEQNKKVYKPGTIRKYQTPLGLRFWVADDGSLEKNNEMIQHSSGFTKEMNHIMSDELNEKFGQHSKVVPSKEKYWVIYIPASDARVLRNLLDELPSSMKRKLPKDKRKRKSTVLIAAFIFAFQGFYLVEAYVSAQGLFAFLQSTALSSALSSKGLGLMWCSNFSSLIQVDDIV